MSDNLPQEASGRRSNEQGVALIVAILGLVVMGGLVTAAFTTTFLEARLADNTRRAAQGFAAAEFGLAQTVDGWNVAAYNSMAVMDSVPVSGATPHGSGSYNGYVIRMAEDLFLVEITGSGRGGLSQQRVGEFLRAVGLQVDTQASLTVQGPTRIGGNANVAGTDAVPSGWSSCPTPDATTDQGGVRLPDPTQLTFQGSQCAEGACITGSPPVEADAAVSDATFTQFGDIDWAQLTQYAVTIPPGNPGAIAPAFDAVTGACDASVATNWGDPLNPASKCGAYFPIIYAPGSLHLNSGAGQGMLLVEGDLQVSGGFQHYGVVIVQGSLSSTGQGGHFNGAVMARNVNLADTKILGSAVIQFSSCATARALKAAAPASRLPSRGWVYR